MRRFALSVIVLLACSPANVNDPEYWTAANGGASTTDDDADAEPPVEDAGSEPPPAPTSTPDAAAPDAGKPAPPTTGNCLHLEFTTKTYFGRYTPSHVAAVWITDAAGKFVKTLALYGVRRTSNLYGWRTASKGNTVDVVTQATLKSHGTLKFDWNCTDVTRARVAAGTYKVFAEFTESNVSGAGNAGPAFNAPFVVGGGATKQTPPDDKAFTAKLVTTP